MSVTLRSIIIACCLIFVAALLYRYSNMTGQISTEEIRARFPTFTADDFSGVVYSSEGDRMYSVSGDRAVYYQDKGLIEFDALNGTFYQKNGEHWHITAGKGEVIHNTSASLYDGVVLTPASSDSEIRKITTPEVLYDIPANILKSDGDIEIEGKNFTDRGGRYEADLNRKTIVIRDRPHVIYHTEK